LVGVVGDLQQDVLHHFDACVAAFAHADRAGSGKPMPRATLPDIQLNSPKITRKLTTAWFAERVNERYLRCLKRVGGE